MSSTAPVLQLRSQRGPIDPPVASTPPLLLVGFRPFFFGATLAALFLVPAWLLTLSGNAATSSYWGPQLFHAHEMLLGYTGAVIVGFLLTASSNWTGVDVASGPRLGLLAVWWALGRVAPFIVGIPEALIAVVDITFLPAVAWVVGRAMWRTQNRRNYFFVPLLLAFTVSNLLFHAEQNGFAATPGLGRDIALRVIAFMILVIGGRVFPMFTRNATGGSSKIRRVDALDRLALGSFLLACLCEFSRLPSALCGVTWVMVGFLNAARMSTWGVHKARAPLLWILHAGYFATALSFVLQGGFLLGFAPYASALHCFTVGGIGLLTLGMMARVSLGHSGRMLVAPPSVTWAFAALTIAAIVRVAVPLALPQWLSLSWLISGGLWTLSFALFLSFGWKVWSRPRVDR